MALGELAILDARRVHIHWTPEAAGIFPLAAHECFHLAHVASRTR
jgi:hypothetical protein